MRPIPTARVVGIRTAGAVVEPRLVIMYMARMEKILSGGSLEELDVAMLSSQARSSNNVKKCVRRASVAAASLTLSCKQKKLLI